MTLFQGKYRNESLRLPGRDYSEGLYLVTICTKNRIPWFGTVCDGRMFHTAAGCVIKDEWAKTGCIRPNVLLDAFVVMPDHVHMIIRVQSIHDENYHHHCHVGTPWHGVPTGPIPTYHGHGISIMMDIFHDKYRFMIHRPKAWHHQWHAGVLGSIIGQFKQQCTKRIRALGYTDFAWQSRFYESVVHDQYALDRIRRYIINNPKQDALSGRLNREDKDSP